eukprot:197386_1
MPRLYNILMLSVLSFTEQISARSQASKTMFAANTLYTADFLDNSFPFFGKSVMEISSMHHINPERPIWDVKVELNNTKGNAISGFVGFEYQKYETTRHAMHQKKTQIYITNVCDLHESMVHKRFLHNSHLKHSDTHVVPFRFDSANSKEQHETLLIETKHHIKESG